MCSEGSSQISADGSVRGQLVLTLQGGTILGSHCLAPLSHFATEHLSTHAGGPLITGKFNPASLPTEIVNVEQLVLAR